MDFIIFYTLIGTVLQLILFSYDIVCQWHRNLAKRLPQLPEVMRISLEQLQSARYVVPKFHIYAHGLLCQTRFSLNFLPFMARIDGEDPERWWAHINPVSMSTKEMGPGARLDTIDDHAGAWNWRKITGLGRPANFREPFSSLIITNRHNSISSTEKGNCDGEEAPRTSRRAHIDISTQHC
jgi:Kyakuja-Dileera-Zisupton transposase